MNHLNPPAPKRSGDAPRLAPLTILPLLTLLPLTASSPALALEPEMAVTPANQSSDATSVMAADALPTESAEETARAIVRKRFFIGAVGGFALVSASHPELGTGHLMGPVLGLQAGYVVSPRWSISADFTNFETSLTRVSPGEPFTTSSSWLRPLAGCETCQPRPRGGYVVGTTMHLSTLSPRVEVTPFGPDGLYLGASAGIAFIGGLEARTGAAGTARVGFRYRPLKALTIAAEGGAQGQAYSDASAAMYFAAAQARLHF